MSPPPPPRLTAPSTTDRFEIARRRRPQPPSPTGSRSTTIPIENDAIDDAIDDVDVDRVVVDARA